MKIYLCRQLSSKGSVFEMKEKKLAIQGGKFNFEVISTYRNEIYGLSIFWVMLFHICESHYFPVLADNAVYNKLMVILGMGNMGVDIFLFLSGICLYFSFTKKPDIYAFIKKRITRIMYPICLTSMLLWIRYLVMHRISIWGFVNRLFLIQYWIDGDRQIWYISLIMLLYLVYPYIYLYMFRKNEDKSSVIRAMIMIGVIVIITIGLNAEYPKVYHAIDLALPRVPIFLTGCIVGKFVYEKRKISSAIPLGVIVAFVVGYKLTNKWNIYENCAERYVYWIGGVAVTLLFAILFSITPKWFNNIWSKWGVLSLEIYLSHIVIRRELATEFAKSHLGLEWWMNILIIFVGAYIWAKIVAWLVKQLNQRVVRN